MEEKRYMKNTVTGVVMEYNKDVIKVSPHIAECTPEGILIGRAPVAENTMLERITELQEKFEQAEARAKNFEMAAQNERSKFDLLKEEKSTLEKENAELKEKIAKLESEMPSLLERLSSMKVAELRQIASERDIANIDDLKKEELIAAIIATEEK